MKIPDNIIELKHIYSNLSDRWILEQYKKSKSNILLGNFSGNNWWPKQPISKWIWYFRINRQFRAIWYRENKNFIVTYIDNHQ